MEPRKQHDSAQGASAAPSSHRQGDALARVERLCRRRRPARSAAARRGARRRLRPLVQLYPHPLREHLPAAECARCGEREKRDGSRCLNTDVGTRSCLLFHCFIVNHIMIEERSNAADAWERDSKGLPTWAGRPRVSPGGTPTRSSAGRCRRTPPPAGRRSRRRAAAAAARAAGARPSSRARPRGRRSGSARSTPEPERAPTQGGIGAERGWSSGR